MKKYVRITRVTRKRSSVNGNPRFEVGFDDGTAAKTSPDAMLAYGIENPGYRDRDLEVVLDGRGNVTYINNADGSYL